MCDCFGAIKSSKKKKRGKKIDSDNSAIIQSCGGKKDDVAQEPETAPKSKPTLLKLIVTGATELGGDKYWAVKDANKKIKITAVTNPDDESGWAELKWNGAPAISEDNRTATVDRSSVKDMTVTATLDDVAKSASIEIYDLVSLTCPLPNGKGYKSDKTTLLKAVTNPNEAKVWNLLTWSEGTVTAEKNGCNAALKPVGERGVSVALGEKKLETTLRICQWPKLKIEEVTFECHEVLNDGAAEIDTPFDKKWVSGRKDPAVNQATKDSQSPICFTRGKKIKLSAKFKVAGEKATDNENVLVKADLGFGTAKIEGTVAVGKGADEASLALTESSEALPDTVDAESAWSIKWQSVDHDGATWFDAGASTHLRYVLLGDPNSKIYFTLLDISCVAAKGKNSADDLVAESFKPFAGAKGTGSGFARKGDGVRMSYYNKGSSTATGDAVQTTAGMLGSADGTGRCGGWATLLRHMWDMHGVASSRRWFIRATDESLMNFDLRFLVKNCKFKASGTRAGSAYTHEGAIAKKEVEKQDGIPGHGQDNPQFDFGDHVVVIYGGKLYDPSYGVGPYATDALYLKAALCGLGKWPRIDFQFKSIDQHMPTECVPYDEGFSEYTIVLNPLDFLAKSYGTNGAALMPYCDFYDSTGTVQKHPKDKSEVKTGMLVKIRTSTGDIWDKMGPTMTLGDIASRHSTTEDKIFDHAKNAAVKALRGNKGGLETGDTIVVPKDLDSNCWLVFGHDI